MSEQDNKHTYHYKKFKEEVIKQATKLIEDKITKDYERDIVQNEASIDFFENDLWDSVELTQAYYNLVKDICDDHVFPQFREEYISKYQAEEEERREDNHLRNATIGKIRRGEV